MPGTSVQITINWCHFQWPWTNHNPVFKVRPFFDAKYITNGYRYGHSYYIMRIGNRTQAFVWHYFQWHWVTSKPDFKVMVLLLVFMQLTRDLFAIAKLLLNYTVNFHLLWITIFTKGKIVGTELRSVWSTVIVKLGRRRFRRDSKVLCEGAHALCGTVSRRGLNPIKLAYDPRWPDGRWQPAIAKGRYCHVMYKLLYPSISSTSCIG